MGLRVVEAERATAAAWFKSASRNDTDYRQMKPVIDSGRIVATDIRPQPAFHGRRRMKVA